MAGHSIAGRCVMRYSSIRYSAIIYSDKRYRDIGYSSDIRRVVMLVIIGIKRWIFVLDRVI